MKRDRQLVNQFLIGYNFLSGSSFTATQFPEDEDRTKPAVEVIATDGTRTMAIEHTLLEPFVGQKEDDVRFLKVFGSLEGAPDLLKAGFDVDLIVSVGAIPKGFDWAVVALRVREQLSKKIKTVSEIDAVEVIEGLQFRLPVRLIVQCHHAGGDDHVWLSRGWPGSESLPSLVRKALSSKLPKLVGTPADLHVLLLEKATIAGSYGEVRHAIDELKDEFKTDLAQTEIWTINTVSFESSGTVFLYELYPNILGRRMVVEPKGVRNITLG